MIYVYKNIKISVSVITMVMNNIIKIINFLIIYITILLFEFLIIIS